MLLFHGQTSGVRRGLTLENLRLAISVTKAGHHSVIIFKAFLQGTLSHSFVKVGCSIDCGAPRLDELPSAPISVILNGDADDEHDHEANSLTSASACQWVGSALLLAVSGAILFVAFMVNQQYPVHVHS